MNKDFVKTNLLALEKGTNVYNVALWKCTAIIEFANKIIELTKSKSQIKFLNERPGDIRYSLADVAKFNEIGFELSYSLESGLNETFCFMRIN